MRRSNEKSSAWLAVVAAAAAAFAGCSAEQSDPKGGLGSTGAVPGVDGPGPMLGPDGQPIIPEGCTQPNLTGNFRGIREDESIGDYRSPLPTCACGGSVPGEKHLRRLTSEELVTTLQVAFGGLPGGLPPLELGPDTKLRMTFTNDVDSLAVGRQTAEQLLGVAETIATAATQPNVIGSLSPCTTAAADRACASTVIADVGARLFRRPLPPAEVEGYLEVFDEVAPAADFPEALKWTLVSLIQSPHTIYRPELGGVDADGSVALGPYELASALSYNYTGGPPDAQLLARAEAGELADPQVRVDEALRLLRTDAGKRVVMRFFDEWLQLRAISTATRNNAGPDWEQTRQEMVAEALFFVEELVFNRGGTLDDLFSANFTVLNDHLADFYGFPFEGPRDGSFQVVLRPEGRGRGVLALGAVLAGASQAEFPSPTQRGLKVLERFFCTPRPLPRENVDMDLGSKTGNTVREKLEEVHAAQVGCASCHKYFDPFGYGFEFYDETGRWRTEENGFPLNAATTVSALDDLPIDGQEELTAALADSDTVRNCVSGTMTQYFYGGVGECRAVTARSDFERGDVPILQFMASLAAEPHLLSRQ